MIPQATDEEEQLAMNIHHKFKKMDIPTLVDELDDEKLTIEKPFFNIYDTATGRAALIEILEQSQRNIDRRHVSYPEQYVYLYATYRLNLLQGSLILKFDVDGSFLAVNIYVTKVGDF